MRWTGMVPSDSPRTQTFITQAVQRAVQTSMHQFASPPSKGYAAQSHNFEYGETGDVDWSYLSVGDAGPAYWGSLG